MFEALPHHPRTGLQAIGLIHGRPVWPVMGAAEGDDGEAGDQEQRDDQGDANKDWKAEAEKWKAQSRKNEDRAKANAAAAKERDDLVSANASEQEKAVKAARDEARADALREATPRIVRAEFRAAANGRSTREQLDAALEDLDLSRFVTDSGDVDEDRIAKKIDALWPQGDPVDDKRRVLKTYSQGQGPRDGDSKPSVASGREMFEARRGKPAS